MNNDVNTIFGRPYKGSIFEKYDKFKYNYPIAFGTIEILFIIGFAALSLTIIIKYLIPKASKKSQSPSVSRRSVSASSQMIVTSQGGSNADSTNKGYYEDSDGNYKRCTLKNNIVLDRPSCLICTGDSDSIIKDNSCCIDGYHLVNSINEPVDFNGKNCVKDRDCILDYSSCNEDCMKTISISPNSRSFSDCEIDGPIQVRCNSDDYSDPASPIPSACKFNDLILEGSNYYNINIACGINQITDQYNEWRRECINNNEASLLDSEDSTSLFTSCNNECYNNINNNPDKYNCLKEMDNIRSLPSFQRQEFNCCIPPSPSSSINNCFYDMVDMVELGPILIDDDSSGGDNQHFMVMSAQQPGEEEDAEPPEEEQSERPRARGYNNIYTIY